MSKDVTKHESEILNNESLESRIYAMLVYVTSLIIGFIGPLVIWAMKHKDSRLVYVAGKTYLNTAISYVIYMFISMLFIIIPTIVLDNNEGHTILFMSCMVFGTLLIMVINLLYFVYKIIAAIKFASAEVCKAPFTIPFIK